MKKIGFILFLTLLVLLAAGAINKGYWIAYAALVSTCVALIVKKDRYLKISTNQSAKTAIVFVLTLVSICLLYWQRTGSF